MSDENSTPKSRYAQFLPSILTQEEQNSFFMKYLGIWEAILHGKKDEKGLHQILDEIESLYTRQTFHSFLPEETAKEFLSWLGTWFDLSFAPDRPEEKKSQFIKEMLPLYRYRGTEYGLKEMLKAFHRLYDYGDFKIKIIPNPGEFIIGQARLRKDYLGAQTEHNFHIEIEVKTNEQKIIDGCKYGTVLKKDGEKNVIFFDESKKSSLSPYFQALFSFIDSEQPAGINKKIYFKYTTPKEQLKSE